MTDAPFLTNPWRLAWWATYAPVHAPGFDPQSVFDLDRWLHGEPSTAEALA